MKIDLDKYRIELKDETSYSSNSVDNLFQYEHQYVNEENYKPTSQIGIKLYKGDIVISSAIVKSTGGASGIHKTSQIVKKDSITICCAKFLFNLSIPNLTLNWMKKADDVTCFQIFNYEGDFIIHGELHITRISSGGEILWQSSGADIFTTATGEEVFEIKDDIILVSDWNNNQYKFNINGKLLN